MMEMLQPNSSYHIFNHANGFENVFREPENCRYFIEKYCLYISPIAETYAYCLMPNHFHLVVWIRRRETIEKIIINSNSSFSKVLNFGKAEKIKNEIVEKYISKQFANFFSCYTQSFNKRYDRMGSLFIKNFKRQPIEDKQHFLNAIVYTHRNPIHHGFRKDFHEWEYSSYNQIMAELNNITQSTKLLKMVGGIDEFINIHMENLQNNYFDDFE